MFQKFVCALMALSLISVSAAEKPLTIDDLDLKSKEFQPNTKLQEDLAMRSTMLKWHQWLGIAALVPMIGNYVLGSAQGDDITLRNLHTGMGIATASLYMASATFAIFAPKPDGIKDTGSTKWHRWLSYIHFPLMIAVPILGNFSRQQVNNGEKLTGAATLHSPAATALLATYVVSVTIMVFNF